MVVVVGAEICFSVKAIVFNQRQENKSTLAQAVTEKDSKGSKGS